LWNHYVGTMQPYLKFNHDQPATLRVAARKFEIRILSYQSADTQGTLTFACDTKLIN
jgi:hypothetical protein